MAQRAVLCSAGALRLMLHRQGRTVSFKNTLLVMTSNVGSQVIAKGGLQLGFALPSEDAEGSAYAQIRSLVMEELKSYFRPELLNRMDELVVFRQLGRSEVRIIADLVLAETAARMATRGIGLEVSAAVMETIIDLGYDQVCFACASSSHCDVRCGHGGTGRVGSRRSYQRW
jgi:ATP-dependent Clp protease ATP-binding subunit ClpC